MKKVPKSVGNSSDEESEERKPYTGPWKLTTADMPWQHKDVSLIQRPRVEMAEKRAFSNRGGDALILEALFADLLRIVCGHLEEDKDYLAFRHSCVDFSKLPRRSRKGWMPCMRDMCKRYGRKRGA